MDDQSKLPPPPWWPSREARRAVREERRRERRETRDAARVARHGSGSSRQEREAVTPGRIAVAALRVIDAEGLEALTVRRLATELGLGAMTLYWYVQNKDQVLDLVIDQVFSEIVLPEPSDDWRATARELAVDVRAVLLRHPNAAPLVIARGSVGPGGLRLLEAALAALRGAGFDSHAAADAYFSLSNYVTGFCAAQTSNPHLPDQTGLDRRRFADLVRDYIRSLPADRYPNLTASADYVWSTSMDERFAFGLDCLLDGLADQLRQSQATTPAAETAS